MYIRVGFLRIPATQEKITWHSFQHAYNRKSILQYPPHSKAVFVSPRFRHYNINKY